MDSVMWNIDWAAMLTPERSVLEMFVRATIMYFVITILMRVVVKRQTGAIGRTDILVVVLIAEIAGPGFTADYISVIEGAVLVATVLLWSFVIEWLSQTFPAFERIFEPPPLMLVENGQMILRNMRAELITKAELMTHLREEGIGDIGEVAQARIEPDGMISIIRKGDAGGKGGKGGKRGGGAKRPAAAK